MWGRIKAFFRWDLESVCRHSTGAVDYHDYPDSEEGVPRYFWTYTCKRCGKKFEI